ncbi:heat-inducible transcriptional repressor HrcA [Enteractinococcus coprophilus]|uniref:Heat-inducible transcription repressor HrcA n=1 Tax=Enteractinococcus coprophilus TaxID=1027633 RepID=A0A543AJF3_9MICC|nr:heat-inducible transcriptional repressor HrcA [Enteractinococcus coprophilus]TQL72718.1 heat-inducible transcription repressor HrcA [Enteractinococcus coprophilus]
MTDQPRRMKVLQAIVEDYVASREPVGSKALVERHNLGVSSATVRNDMADLEDEGLIAAPHTSSGRIPTDKGYRYFVDRISEVRPLSAAEKRAVQALLDNSDDIDDMMAATVQVLSQLTRQVAVIQYPHMDSSVIRRVEFVLLSEDRMLAVLILSTGRVDQRVVYLGQTVDQPTLDVLAQVFMKYLDNVSPYNLTRALMDVHAAIPQEHQALAKSLGKALELLAEAGHRDRILMAGTANLARSPQDFSHSIGPILETLEEQVVLLKLLTEMENDAHGLSVRIGDENFGSLGDTSVVAAGYGPGDVAKIGVVGPTRMDYPSTMSAVRAIARYLSRILSS